MSLKSAISHSAIARHKCHQARHLSFVAIKFMELNPHLDFTRTVTMAQELYKIAYAAVEKERDL